MTAPAADPDNRAARADVDLTHVSDRPLPRGLARVSI
jgi:hypothetical protein